MAYNYRHSLKTINKFLNHNCMNVKFMFSEAGYDVYRIEGFEGGKKQWNFDLSEFRFIRTMTKVVRIVNKMSENMDNLLSEMKG
jgi:hypothetical protein